MLGFVTFLVAVIKCLAKANKRKGALVLGTQFEDTVHLRKETMVAGSGGGSSLVSAVRKRERDTRDP